jgi:hypothetical protein
MYGVSVTWLATSIAMAAVWTVVILSIIAFVRGAAGPRLPGPREARRGREGT